LCRKSRQRREQRCRRRSCRQAAQLTLYIHYCNIHKIAHYGANTRVANADLPKFPHLKSKVIEVIVSGQFCSRKGKNKNNFFAVLKISLENIRVIYRNVELIE
jgi:hypothetical protein